MLLGDAHVAACGLQSKGLRPLRCNPGVCRQSEASASRGFSPPPHPEPGGKPHGPIPANHGYLKTSLLAPEARQAKRQPPSKRKKAGIPAERAGSLHRNPGLFRVRSSHAGPTKSACPVAMARSDEARYPSQHERHIPHPALHAAFPKREGHCAAFGTFPGQKSAPRRLFRSPQSLRIFTPSRPAARRQPPGPQAAPLPSRKARTKAGSPARRLIEARSPPRPAGSYTERTS